MANPNRVRHPDAEALGLTVADSTTIATRVHRLTAEEIRRRAEAERIAPSELIRRAIDAELRRPQALVASMQEDSAQKP